ncbi:alcohol dehydrogenase [Janthinobacterium sp. BJB412]|nr:alcohol dehydrogenase [Janthinobacterium sp. BJB412]
MTALRLEQPGLGLALRRVAIPQPAPNELLLRVSVCGVCRTDLHLVDGELPLHRLPLIPGHEVVGHVVQAGRETSGFAVGERVGVAWLGGSCGHCAYCGDAHENLCDNASFTGYDRDGGYAEYMVADARYVFRLPERYDDEQVAPLLCAGLIGYRAYAMAGPGKRLGLYGFGAAAHIIAQVARHQGREVYAFTRPGDVRSQNFARELGAVWAGGSDEMAPDDLHAAIIFAANGALLPKALGDVAKGGSVVCAGIHMSDIPAFPYALLWGERSVRSVANLTRADGEAFFRIAAELPLRTRTTAFALRDAQKALDALRAGDFDGAAVLRCRD